MAGWQMQYAPIMTDWARQVDTNSPLPEYPRPQMVRTDWLSLNGVWQFQGGNTNDPVPVNQALAGDILVPFPMESALSGVARYYPHSWYRRLFTVPAGWNGRRILLHLDAVDWESEVFINGQSVGLHRGGYDPAMYDITPQLRGSGPQEMIVRVYDPTDAAGMPRGKQTLYPGGIMYTSCSGIWQPVWLEPVPISSVAGLKLVPDIDTQRLRVTTTISGPTNGLTIHATARVGTNLIGSISGAPGAELSLPVPNPTLWCPTNPFLYDLEIALSNGLTRVDGVASYFGMRKISLGTTNGFVKLLLNNQFVFQFGPLDQGFWPDGIYTAPTDDALKSDIEQEKILGYNMVRKHIKVERSRWYYWADKLGLLVWQDMPSANSYTSNPQPLDVPQFATELTRMVQNHWNHPSIIMWVIFNESQGQHDTAALVQQVKTLDPSRLVNEASGGSYYGSGDVLDVHSYPDPAYPTSGTQAAVCGEFGGVGLGITNHTWAPGWGYISAVNGDDLAAKFEGFCQQLSDFVQHHGLSAAVYTEITDVEIELNGFLTYDRKVRKPDADRIRQAIASASAPITLTTVVPTSQAAGQTWKYTTTTPAANWPATGFNDANWSTGTAGFGANNPPNTSGLIRTTWNTADIWLRRTFNPGNLSSQQISNLFFVVYHDEDAEFYINGVLAVTAPGYTTGYGLSALSPAGRAAVLPNAVNVLAVHCHQTGGGQYIDVGLTVRDSSVMPQPLPLPPAPSNLRASSALTGVSLAWNSSPNASNYKLKRSTTSGGPYTNTIVLSPVNCATDTAVSPGNTYYYVVSATNSSGESDNSNEVGLTIPALPPPLPKAWFKADALSGLGNGAPIAIWPDASGNAFNATQTNPGMRPTYASSAINGLPAVHFNATNSNSLAFARPVQDDFTIFCVYRSAQGLGTGTQFYQGAGLVNGEVPSVDNDFGLSLNASGNLLAGTGNPDVSIASSSATFADGQPHIVTFKRTRATGALALFVDGSAQGTASAGNQSLTAPAQLVLGAQQTLINYLTGDIAEVKIYEAALGDADRVAEETALACKYKLGGGAAPATPRGLSATANNRQVFVTWIPVTGATGYKVNWSVNLAGPYTQLIGNLTTNSYSHTTALNGQTNYYRVSAYSACGLGTSSAPVAAWLPLPTLGVSRENSFFTLTWPDWASDWLLWSATNPTPPIFWQPITNAATITNGQFNLTLPFRWSVELFRLASP